MLKINMKKIITIVLCLIMTLSIFAGCNSAVTTAPTPSAQPTVSTPEAASLKTPKYVFLFVGDGMSYVQVNAAQVYLGNNKSGEVETKSLNFTEFPVLGSVTTHDSTSFCPDSASTATALSCGVKTHSGVIGLEVDKVTRPESITEILKKPGMKIGVVSSVTINHATPAAFYSHVVSRNDYYDIAMQLATSGFDYYGGGSVSKATGDGTQTDAYTVIENAGYKIAKTKEDILSLGSASGKTYALSPVLQDSGSMPYAIDAKEGDLKLADYVQKGIDVLDNENGFFLMCESGKIDWSCHANDAMATITEVLDFAESIQVAVDFAKEHPDETLILVTGDHETGGMTIGYAATGYSTAFDILNKQKISYVAFDSLIADMKKADAELTLDDVLPVIKENFGLIAQNDPDAMIAENDYVMNEYEFAKLEKAFAQSMLPKEERAADEEASLLYGGYDPLSVTITHIINNKAGIGWTSYSHTGVPVAVYAMGAGAELFGGSYDNTGVYDRLIEVTSGITGISSAK